MLFAGHTQCRDDQIPDRSATSEIKLAIHLAQLGGGLGAGDAHEELLDGADDVLAGARAIGKRDERGGRPAKERHAGGGDEEIAVKAKLQEPVNEFAGVGGDEAILGDAPFQAAGAGGVEGDAGIVDEHDEFGRERVGAPEGVKLAGGGAKDDLGFVQREGALAAGGESVQIGEGEGDGLQVDDGRDGGTPSLAVGVLGEREGGLGERGPVGEEGGPGHVGWGHRVRIRGSLVLGDVGCAMQFDPATLDPADRYKLLIGCIVPRPIAFVSTISPDGRPNLAPFSFFAGVGSNPMMLLFCPANKPDGTEKDSLRNAKPASEGGVGEFVVNVVSEEFERQMAACAEPLEYGESEFELSGLHAVPSVVVRPPRVAESPVSFECRTMWVIRTNPGVAAGGNIVIGEVVRVHMRDGDGLLNERLHTDPSKLRAIGRMGGLGYVRTGDAANRFEMPMGRGALERGKP